MQGYLDEEDRYIAIREGGGVVPGKLSGTLVYSVYDVLGVWHPRGFLVDDILAEEPNYDPAEVFEQEVYISGLFTNTTSMLLDG
jgi:hypothetical protein